MFFTEASIDLADDPELMELMVEANFIATFIGIESPERGFAPRSQEVSERPRRVERCWKRSTGSRTPAWKSGAA